MLKTSGAMRYAYCTLRKLRGLNYQIRLKLFRISEVREMAREKWIPVLPKNYRRIALYAISVATQPVVLVDRKPIVDFSEQGPLTQRGIRSCIDFEIRNGAEPILGFHDHPNEMWITEPYAFVAEHCANEGWLKIEGQAS